MQNWFLTPSVTFASLILTIYDKKKKKRTRKNSSMLTFLKKYTKLNTAEKEGSQWCYLVPAQQKGESTKSALAFEHHKPLNSAVDSIRWHAMLSRTTSANLSHHAKDNGGQKKNPYLQCPKQRKDYWLSFLVIWQANRLWYKLQYPVCYTSTVMLNRRKLSLKDLIMCI